MAIGAAEVVLRNAWLFVQILTWPFGLFGGIVAIVYLTGPRRELRRAADQQGTDG